MTSVIGSDTAANDCLLRLTGTAFKQHCCDVHDKQLFFGTTLICVTAARALSANCDRTKWRCVFQATAETLDGSGINIGNWSATQRDSKVFSHFRYSRRCDAETRIEQIEPLVGLLRHPFAVPGCLPQVL